MQFNIEEKQHELTEGYFMFLTKLGVLFLTAWMLGLLILYTYPCLAWGENKYPPFIRFLNDYSILSWLFVIILFIWYLNKKLKIYKLGFLTNLDFDEKLKLFVFTFIHPLHGKSYKKIVKQDELKIIQTHNSKWTDKQKNYELYENNIHFSSLTPSRTAWKLNSNYSEFIYFLDNYKNN